MATNMQYPEKNNAKKQRKKQRKKETNKQTKKSNHKMDCNHIIYSICLLVFSGFNENFTVDILLKGAGGGVGVGVGNFCEQEFLPTCSIFSP